MPESDESDFEVDPEDPTEGEGSYAEPGGYTSPDGTTGYSGVQSGGRDDGDVGDTGDYEASFAANFAVVGIGIELGGGAVLAGLAADGIIAEATAAGIGEAFFAAKTVFEGVEAFW
jgi:hypothetical protein